MAYLKIPVFVFLIDKGTQAQGSRGSASVRRSRQKVAAFPMGSGGEGPYALVNPCSWRGEEAPTFVQDLSYAVTPFSPC